MIAGWLVNVEMDIVNTDLLKTDHLYLDHLRGVYRNKKTKEMYPFTRSLSAQTIQYRAITMLSPVFLYSTTIKNI